MIPGRQKHVKGAFGRLFLCDIAAMRNLFFSLMCMVVCSAALGQAASIQWMSLEEAVEAQKKEPRKIMMDTRDRIEEIGKQRDANGGEWDGDGNSLLGNFITEEELWACTSCQACVQACPVNISPMGIVLDMRRSLIMEDSKSPESITSMFNNIENNGAPWAFPAASRGDWTQES